MASRHSFFWTFAFVLLVAAGAVRASDHEATQPDARLQVTVLTSQGQPAAGVEVSLVGSRLRARTDSRGQARFEPLPPGSYLVQATAPTGEAASAAVVVHEGEESHLTLALQRASFHEEVVVSAAHPERLVETAKPVSVLAGDQLLLAAQPSLGETLRTQPGVASTFYAPGASRPLLRGQGGDRVRILQSGLDVGDASDTSPDHGVALSPAGLERVEVVRGPAALLYGTETLGGVVNSVGGPLPSGPATTPLGGILTFALGSNAWQRSLAAYTQGQQGLWSWQAAGNLDRANDYRSGFGKVENSYTRNQTASLGLARFGTSGFAGLGFQRFATEYGSPVEEEVHVELFYQRWEFRGETATDLGPFNRIRFALADVAYHHQEFEGSEVGTRVDNDLQTGRIEAYHRALGPFSGVLGVEASARRLAVTGEETYLPWTDTDRFALFFWEHGDLGPVHAELAGRWDATNHRPRGAAPRRSFDLASVGGSLTLPMAEPVKVYLAFGYTGKTPNPEELYSRGPHAATGLYEVGDPDLRLERNRHWELGVRWVAGPTTGQLNLFRSQVDRFIFQSLTGEVEDDFPVAQFRQADARFWGAELSGHWDLSVREASHLELTFGGDWIRGELARNGGNLPRIPPGRLFAHLNWLVHDVTVRFEVYKVAAATRLAPEETRTPGYTLANLVLGWRLLGNRVVHNLWLKGSNLADAKALNHTSFFKEKTPLPGRNVTFLYQLLF